MSDNQTEKPVYGANLNIVASSDAYSLNAPYATRDNSYTVLAHGPTQKNEMFIYSRADCTDNACTKISPAELSNAIKHDPNYHEGQSVTLFACNAGKWGEASYAQALSNEMGIKVFAPTENIVGLLDVGTDDDKGHDQFNGWVVSKGIKQVDPQAQPKFMNILGNVITTDAPTYNKIISDPYGKLIFLDIDSPGKFQEFSPIRDLQTESQSKITSPNIIASEAVLDLFFSNLAKEGMCVSEIEKLKGHTDNIIANNLVNNTLPDIEMYAQLNIDRETEIT